MHRMIESLKHSVYSPLMTFSISWYFFSYKKVGKYLYTIGSRTSSVRSSLFSNSSFFITMSSETICGISVNSFSCSNHRHNICCHFSFIFYFNYATLAKIISYIHFVRLKINTIPVRVNVHNVKAFGIEFFTVFVQSLG